MHSVNEFEEETVIHALQVLDTEAALFLYTSSQATKQLEP